MKAGWKAKNLDQLCEIFADGDWIESKDQSPSGIRLVQTGNVGNGVFKDRAEKARYISEDTFRRLRCTEILEGDCLVSRLPDPIARSCLIPSLSEKCITAVDCTIIRFDRSKIMPELFNYFSQSRDYAAAVAGSVGGATRQRISRKNLGLLQIPLPPLDEQRRIVTVLDKAFAGIATVTANAQKNLTNARVLFESYLVIELTRKNGDLKNQRLGEIVDVVSGAGFPKSAQGSAGEKYPFYKVSDMNLIGNEVFMKSENNSISEETRRALRASAMPAGSVIFPKIGGAIATNKKRILTKPSCVDNNVMGLCPKSGKVDSEFLFYWLKTINISVFANDSELPSIRKPTVENFPIKMPKEIKRQRELTGILKEIEAEAERLVSLNSRKLASLTELKRSLLQKAFAGELT